MGKESKYHAYFTSKAARNKDWYCEQGIKQQRLIWHRGMHGHWIWVTKNKGGQKNDTVVFNWIQCLAFQYTVFFVFFSPQLFTRFKRSSSCRGKMIWKWSEGKQKLLRVVGGSSYLESTVFYSKWRLYVRRRHIPGINIALLITYCQVTDLNFPQFIACLFGAGRP